MRVVLVGASSSVGSAVKARFLAQGAQVVQAGSPDVDLTDAGSIHRFAQGLAVAALKQVDALVVLAGLCPGKALADYGMAQIDEVFAVNTLGPMRLIQALLPRLAQGSQVLLMSSISAERGSFDPIYAASKGALAAFVRSMARCMPAVRFNAVAPGLIEGSGMWAAMAEERRAEHLRQTPTRRLVTLAEIAGIIVELCGPTWQSLNGQVIAVDGGR